MFKHFFTITVTTALVCSTSFADSITPPVLGTQFLGSSKADYAITALLASEAVYGIHALFTDSKNKELWVAEECGTPICEIFNTFLQEKIVAPFKQEHNLKSEVYFFESQKFIDKRSLVKEKIFYIALLPDEVSYFSNVIQKNESDWSKEDQEFMCRLTFIIRHQLARCIIYENSWISSLGKSSIVTDYLLEPLIVGTTYALMRKSDFHWLSSITISLISSATIEFACTSFLQKKETLACDAMAADSLEFTQDGIDSLKYVKYQSNLIPFYNERITELSKRLAKFQVCAY